MILILKNDRRNYRCTLRQKETKNTVKIVKKKTKKEEGEEI